MPKIVINEYDLTKAGTVPYSNFAVVVPGFLGEDKYVEETLAGFIGTETTKTTYTTKKLGEAARAVFDENGVYECSSQLDFVNNVGKRATSFVSCKTTTEGVAAKVDFIIVHDTTLVGDTKYEAATDDKPATFSYKKEEDYTYAFNAIAYGNYPTEEKPIPAIPTTSVDLGNKKISFKKDVYICSAIDNPTHHIGEFRDASNKYIPVDMESLGYVRLPGVDKATEEQTLDLQAYKAPTEDTYYIITNKGKDGKFIEDKVTHYGNQIAYELLGLGYTVLFKAMTDYTEDEVALIAKGLNPRAFDEETEKIPAFKDFKEADALVAAEGEADTKKLASEFSSINQLSDPNFWECLKDKSTYDFRYLVTGLMTNNDGANKCILEVADHSEEILLDDASISDGRGDCIALIDLDSKTYVGKTQTAAIPKMAKEAAEWSSAYAAVFAPYVTYLMPDDADYDNNKTFPASFHYLACAANSANNNYSEWYANAGYTRGVSKYTIESTGCKFGEVAIQALEPRFLLQVGKELNEDGTAYNDINTTVAINLIVKIKSSYYLWGNRTGKKLGTRGASDGDLVAQHFLNIRQLSTTIKKQVYVTCRRLTFDPNSSLLWLNFVSLLQPMLEGMKADQGIKDYKIVQNATDRKALLTAKIRIVPIEAVEDFEIGLYLEDNLSDAVVTEG